MTQEQERIRQAVYEAFVQRYRQRPLHMVRAPGRVNLIGEHTDYNDGFVLPMAIDREVVIALTPRQDKMVQIYSLDFAEVGTFDLADFVHDDVNWLEYVKGTAAALQGNGYDLQGWEGVMMGNIPIGAGLSSSAALELATARAFTAVADLPWSPLEMALVGQKAENDWVGVNCGIMDQMISAAGHADHALLIDCRSLATETVPLPSQATVIVMDTMTRRGLVDSAYNERRQQCEAAATYFGVKALRDLSRETFAARANGLSKLVRRRAQHIISENDRVLLARKVMAKDDAVALGELMTASHISLRDDFEVSSSELNLMVDLAQQQPSCFGARMTGAGFGGCAVALVGNAGVDDFVTAVSETYQHKTKRKPNIYICRATDGASVLAQ